MDTALLKATIEAFGDPETQVEVLFNPNEYTFQRSNSYKTTQIPGLGTPLLQFVNGESDTLSMELFLDDLTDPSGPDAIAQGEPAGLVHERLTRLFNLMDINRELHAPPVVIFTWGVLSFTAVIEKMSRKITLFTPSGTPARATVAVTFKEYRTISQQVENPRRESSDKSKRRLIVGLDNIYLLAFREYDDINRWREIANANDLDDPREVAAGDWLLVPPLEDEDGSRNSF